MPYFSDICFLAKCEFPFKFPVYLDNLHRLGLVEVYYDQFIIFEELYTKLKKHDSFPIILNEEEEKIDVKSMYALNEFGKNFVVCVWIRIVATLWQQKISKPE